MKTINAAGLALIKEFEDFRAEAYRDSAGVWTIGYGTTDRAGVGITPRPGMVITKAEAEFYLEKAISKFIAEIEPSITAPINENEFAAFVSLAYNIGPTAFKKSSALRHFNAGDKARAAQNILLWNKAGGKVLSGLVRRREAEKTLFLSPAQVAAPPAPPAEEIPHQARPISGLGAIGVAVSAACVAIAHWWCSIPLLSLTCGG